MSTGKFAKPNEKPLRFHRNDLVAYLQASLGTEKATDVVMTAAIALGLGVIQFQRAQALSVFEKITEEKGLVGIAARLAISRLRVAKSSSIDGK